ncbi:MAG: hypothetical protein LBS26_02140 [Campylobacteraceae bacterium]|nr:hypothetical protein [Campylobacteraceae bacterium]
MRIVIFLLLSIALLFGANITDITHSDKHDKKSGAFNLILSFDGSFNTSFEQKYEDGAITLIFDGLNSNKPFMKTFSDSAIQSVSIKQSDKNSTKISFASKQLFDISISNNSDKLYIALTPKAVPLTMEDIVKNTGDGKIISYILDILFYVVIGLFVLTAALMLFLKVKLFSVKKTETIEEPENSTSELNSNEIKIKKSTLPRQPKTKPQKKKIPQKTLFD